MGEKKLKMQKLILVSVLLFVMTANSRQGAHATATWLAQQCMNGNNVPAAAQTIVYTAINTAFAALGRRRAESKHRRRRMSTAAWACTQVYNAAASAGGMPPAAANCFRTAFVQQCSPQVLNACRQAGIPTAVCY